MKPKFITFTGADESADIGRMNALSYEYPIEWGILFSMKRQGSPRYSSMAWIEGLKNHARITGGAMSSPMKFSAHLCGAYAVDVVDGKMPEYDFLKGFSRIQINTIKPNLPTRDMLNWAFGYGCELILQCRGDFPVNSLVNWLYDVSGGNGRLPDYWPEAPEETSEFDPPVGYAGGLNPDNITAVMLKLETLASKYWIDMESGVRTDQKFDLDKCEQICKLVYEK